MLDKVKMAMRITTDKLDDLLLADIDSAKIDLGIAGIKLPEQMDSIIERAIITYCQLQEGKAEDYDRLKRSYDEQKAQLSMSSRYSDYEERDSNTTDPVQG